MVTLSACIEMLFGEEPDFVSRVDRAADAGLRAVEFWSHSGKNLAAIRERAKARGVAISSISLESQPLVEHDNTRYLEAVRAGIAACKTLGCPTAIATTGNDIPGWSRERMHQRVVDALKAAAPVVEDAGLTLVLEPLNTLVDHKGYFLWSSLEGFQIVDEVGSPAVKLLFDIYHQQVMEGNLIANTTGNIEKIGHFHMADVPGRYEPGTGEINYENVLKAIGDAGYDRCAALECRPSTGNTVECLQPILAIRDRLGMG